MAERARRAWRRADLPRTIVFMPDANENARTSAYYAGTISAFRVADESAVLGKLAGASGLSLDGAQLEAWKRQITLLKTALAGTGICG